MSEMDEKLNTLLSDPGSMARIMQLAQQLSGTMGGAEKSTPEPPPPPPAAPEDQAVLVVFQCSTGSQPYLPDKYVT